MAYTTINKSTDYFNTKLYTGNSSVRTLTGVGFQPDFVWIKDRTNARDHMIFDSVRTATKDIHSNNDDSETTIADTLTAFTSDGFSLGADSTAASALVNGNSNNYVSWNWRGASSSGSANAVGSINSTVSANTTGGFSVVKYTGTGSNATVGHGIGIAPEFILVKKYNTTQAWRCGHVGMGWTHGNNLNNGGAIYDSDTYWQDTAPTTTVFSVGTDTEVNGSGATHIAYCFAPVKGFSKFGSYTGNSNTNGPFIYCGFKPAFVLIKNLNTSNHWLIIDNKRSEFNKADEGLFPNENQAEHANSASSGINIVSNGFKIRTTGNAAANYNNNDGDNYLFAAFAEAPLVGTNNVTATAK